MNIPFQPQQPIYFETGIGNSNNGGVTRGCNNVPQYPGSFPRVNLNPQFQIGAYNNAEESFNYPRFEKSWRKNYYSNNPIGLLDISRKTGNAGNGSNRGGLTPFNPPPMWGSYNLATLGVQGGPNQSQAYNPIQTNLEGGVQRTIQLPNVNLGLPVDNTAVDTPEPGEIRRYLAELAMDNVWMANDLARQMPRAPVNVGEPVPANPEPEPQGNMVRGDRRAAGAMGVY